MNRPDELYMYTHPDEWLHWPYLPVIHPPSGRIGVYMEGQRFIETNLFLLKDAKESDWFDKTPEQLIAEGWLVD